MIERVTHAGETYAIIIRQGLPHRGHHFVSHPNDSLQVGVNHYDAGARVKPHFHVPRVRATIPSHETLEVLHIDDGRCRLALYDSAGEEFHASELACGDTVVLLRGGHGLTVLEPTRIVEVKEGPYRGPRLDKVLI